MKKIPLHITDSMSHELMAIIHQSFGVVQLGKLLLSRQISWYSGFNRVSFLLLRMKT